MGWYPCCCKTTCPVCDCFRCGVKVRLTETPGFVCSGSYLTDDIFNGKWVQIDLDPETCEGEYIATVVRNRILRYHPALHLRRLHLPVGLVLSCKTS